MIRIGIVGYGNLGKGVEAAVKNNPDMELAAVFTRRNPESVNLRTPGVKVYPFDKIAEFKGDIDVIVNCGGSATDLPVTTPIIAENFNVIDSFDTHANIPEHFAKVNEIYSRFFTGDCPARSCVEVARLPKDVLIEIEAIVAK